MTNFITWIQAHWGTILAPAVLAIVDLVWAINPSAKSNGLLHWVFLQVGGKDPAV